MLSEGNNYMLYYVSSEKFVNLQSKHYLLFLIFIPNKFFNNEFLLTNYLLINKKNIYASYIFPNV